nr:uncharacterized protein LOC112039889 [Quercus suber]
MKLITRAVICSLWGGQHVDSSYLGSCGASGGVLLMWDMWVVDKVEEAVGRFSVSCKFENVVDQFIWAFARVYGPNSVSERRFLWEELFGLSNWWNVPWCMGGLIDLSLEGGSFTWSNFLEVESKARLDSFLFSTDWKAKLPTVCQRRMSRLLSDHFSIVLEGGAFHHRGRRPFRFEYMWLKDGGFVERLWKDLSELETIKESRGLTAEDKLNLERIQGELEEASLLEEICWRQKSRVLCIRDRDRNTKFFHHIVNSHRRFNSIDRLMVDGELSSDLEDIAKAISHFYRQLYSENVVDKPVLDDVEFSRISEEDALWLDRTFDEEEVYGVINGFNGDKALGSNDVVEIKDFQPINLVGGIYKIISKVLANQFQRVAHGLILDSRNAFVKGRQILDSVLIASECIDYRLKIGILGVLCKLDVEKTYDHVNWGFLTYMLQHCGFSEKMEKMDHVLHFYR